MPNIMLKQEGERKLLKLIVRPDGTGTLIEYEEGEKHEGLCDDKDKQMCFDDYMRVKM